MGSNSIVEGFGGGHLLLPMHTINLESVLVSGEVAVALCAHIPIKGVSFYLRERPGFWAGTKIRSWVWRLHSDTFLAKDEGLGLVKSSPPVRTKGGTGERRHLVPSL